MPKKGPGGWGYLPDLRCPNCGFLNNKVVDVRPREGYITRRRACGWCEHRFTTNETVTTDELILTRLRIYVGGRKDRRYLPFAGVRKAGAA
jgi:hypothetical protein